MSFYVQKMLILVSTVSLPLDSQVAEYLVAHKIWTLEGAGEQAFLSVMGIAPDVDGSILVSDKLANALVRIDSQGRVKNRVQKKGITPGAVNGPGLVAVSDILVAAADFASERIQLLKSDLTSVAEIRAVGPVFSLTFDDEGCLWVGAMGAVAGETLFRYSPEGKELLRLTGQASRGDMFDDMFHLASTGSKIYQVYITRNILEQWDLKGTPLGMTTVSGFPSRVLPARSTPSGGEDVRTAPGILFAACTADANGRMYVLAGDATPHPRRDVFEITSSGEIASVVTLPERCSTIRIDLNGHMVAVENGKTRLSCYKLKRRT